MSRTSIKAPPVHIMSAVQCLATVILTAISLLLWGKVSAYSLALGGLISTLPNAFFARKVFQHRGARQMPRMVKAIYLGEYVKLAMMAAGFALVFVLVEPLNAPTLFLGFVLVHLSGILALIWIQRMPQQGN